MPARLPPPHFVCISLRQYLVKDAHLRANVTMDSTRWRPWSFHPAFILIVIVGLHLLQLSLISWIVLKQTIFHDTSFFTFQDDHMSTYIAWRITPTMVAVFAGFLWGIVDLDVRRLEPFHQMSLPRGARIKESLSMDYGSTISLLTPFASLWYRHYFVTLSSTIYLLAFLVLPLFNDNMWDIQYNINSTGLCTVIVSENWIYATLGLTAMMVLLGSILAWQARTRRYELVADPAGLAGLASLVYDSNVLADFKDIPAFQTQAFIDKKLQNRRFWLSITPEDRSTSIRMNRIVSGVDNGAGRAMGANSRPVQQSTTPFKQSRWEAHPWPLSGRFLLLMNLLSLGPYIAFQIGAQQTVYSNTKSWSPGVMRTLVMLATMISTAYWTLIDADLRVVEPWRQLSLVRSTDSVVRTEAIISDWESMDPVSSVCVGLRRGGASLVAWVSFAGLLSQATTVIYPALFDVLWKAVYQINFSSDDISLQDIPESLITSLAVLKFVSYPLLFINTVIGLALFSRRRPVVPRKPTTMSSKILYLCWSTKLLQDVRDAGSNNMERAEKLRVWNRGYAFGWFRADEGGEMRLGVEREPVEKYCYGKVDG